ncbi:MAG: hypothetical protein ACKVQB_10200 [Bacteroidia bacterium]
MKKVKLILLSLFIIFKSYGQNTRDTLLMRPSMSFPIGIYISPVLDGGAAAVEWTIKNKYALNLYALKRKSDNSIYYNTKVNENLVELMFKIYTSNIPDKKFKTFFGPCIGFRNIVFDETFNFRSGLFGRSVFIDDFGGGNLNRDEKASSKYIVPFYFGFDYKSRHGLIFEYAASVSLQKSNSNLSIRGPLISPYNNSYSWRSRFLFGYQF